MVRALLLGPGGLDERVRDVARVVDCETHGQDEVDDGDAINGEIPHVHQAEDVNVHEDDAEHHHERRLHVGEDEHRDDEHGHQGEAEVGDGLGHNDGILLVV